MNKIHVFLVETSRNNKIITRTNICVSSYIFGIDKLNPIDMIEQKLKLE